MENFKIETTRNNGEPESKKTATEFSYILQRQVSPCSPCNMIFSESDETDKFSFSVICDTQSMMAMARET